MNRIKKLITDYRYEAALFAALMSNFLLFFTKDTIMSDGIYPMHLVDIKAGFISRTVAGTINGILFQNPTKAETAAVHMTVTAITFLLTAIFLGQSVKKAEEPGRKNLFLLCLVVCVLPYGFKTFVNLFELLDIYWLLTIVLCLLCEKKSKTALLIPAIIIFGGWVHFSFVLAFMPVIYVMFLQKCFREKSRFAYVLSAVMIVISVSSTIYFFSTCRQFNVISFDEFTEYILNKAGDKITQFETYCGEAFRPYDEISYDYYLEKYDLPEWTRTASDLKKSLYGYFVFTFIDSSVIGVICDFIFASPFIAFFAALWTKAVKTCGNKTEKFMYFLCLISPLIQVIACLTSSDTSRWLSIMIISDLLLLCLFIRENAVPVADAFNGIMKKLGEHKAILTAVLIFYMSVVFVW